MKHVGNSVVYTAQRPGDCLGLSRRSIEDGWISLKQQKTGALVEIPIHEKLAVALEEVPADQVMLANFGGSGKARYHRFHLAFKKTLELAGLKGLQARDLRRTGITKLSELGASPQWIASVSGHTYQNVTRILEVYAPARREFARQAIALWERAEDGSAQSQDGLR